MNTAPDGIKLSMHNWSTLHAELLWAYRGVINTWNHDLQVDHSYGYWLWYIEKGHVRLETNGKSLSAQKGQWIFCPIGSTKQKFSRDAEILSIHFLAQWPTGENLFSEKDGFIFEAKSHPTLNRCTRELQATVEESFPGVRVVLFEQDTDLEVFLKLQNLLFVLLLEIVRLFKKHGLGLTYASSPDPRIGRALQCLNESALGEPFPLQRLLQRTGLSRVHLDRLLCNSIGISSKEYWERLREGEACHRLENSKQPSKEICYYLGFKQPSHFATWFKRRKGITPAKYRQQTSKRLIG